MGQWGVLASPGMWDNVSWQSIVTVLAVFCTFTISLGIGTAVILARAFERKWIGWTAPLWTILWGGIILLSYLLYAILASGDHVVW